MTTPAIFDGLGFSEMLVVAFVSILVFGGRLPEVMRNLGRGYARLRQGLSDMSRPIRDEIARATTLPPDPPRTPPPLLLGSETHAPAPVYDVAASSPPAPPAPPFLGPRSTPGPADASFDEPPPV